MHITHSLHSDGGSRGNPGPSAYGVALYDENETLIDVNAAYLGIGTNNQAEYKGVIAGLELAKKLCVTDIVCYLDSELVVKQINGEYKVQNGNMKPLYEKLKKLIEGFDSVKFEHVYREKNKIADKLVNLILDAVK